jgi:hypothetical protein
VRARGQKRRELFLLKIEKRMRKNGTDKDFPVSYKLIKAITNNIKKESADA